MRWLIIVVISGLICGCITQSKINQGVVAPIENPRIIERDLSEVRIPIQRPIVQQPVQVAPITQQPAAQIKPVALIPEIEPMEFEIEFVNDSYTQLLKSGKEVLQDVQKQITAADSVVCIGYSNGFTAVGNSLLAAKRADLIAGKLQEFGISREKIKTLAAWSPKKSTDAPAKGVQVFLSLPETVTKQTPI